MPRPIRAAAKNVSYKVKELKTRQRKTKRGANDDGDRAHESFDEEDEEDDEEPQAEDDDDSDEYVEPVKREGDGEEYNDDDNMSVDEEELEEEPEQGPSTEEDEEGDEDGERLIPARQRRRKHMQSFSISLDEMSDLLTPNREAGTSALAGNPLSYNGTLHVKPNKISIKATDTSRKRNRPPSSGKVHKKGEMHSSHLMPDNWRFSYQGPTSEDVTRVSMDEDFLRTTVYPNMKSNIKDFTVLEKSKENHDLAEYMPTFATTKVSERNQEYEMPIMTSQYIPNTEQTGINDCYILNTGFSIWAMDWCPTPTYEPSEQEEDVDYVAIGGLPETAETSIAQDQIYPLGKQDAQANMIQLWSMNCKTNDEGELQGEPSAYLTMCILHHYGAVLDLKWCPTGGLMEADSNDGSLARLGVLAGAFNDGTIRIFNVPDPISLRDHLGMVIPEGSSPETIYIQYSEPYATLRLGDVNFMSINWGTAQRLAAGVTNGTVAVWDMNSMLSQPKETLLEKDSEYFDPIYLPQVHDVCVRTVDWLRSYDPEVLPWIIVTSGYDGHVRYTDLHDPFAQIDIKTILGVPMASACIPWAEGTVYVDIDFGAKIDQLYLESRGFRLFNAKGTIWDFSYSDYQPFLAAAISDGRVKISNPAYKARRGYGMIQNHVYQIEEVSGNDGNTENNAGIEKDNSEEPGQTQEKKEQVIRYKEGEEKEYISKSDGFLDFYGYNVAIQKVQWSRSYHSAAWLASGSAGGMARIDNTMLRKEEGGSGNRIKYGPEPYIIKKRMANGAMYDEQGRRIGIDGQPVKIGRPKKPEAETYRGKIAIARREKEARSLDDDQAGTTASNGNKKPTKGRGKGKANGKANAKGKGKKGTTGRADEDDEAQDPGDVGEAGGREEGMEDSGDTSLSLTRKGSRLSSSLKIAPIFTRVRPTRGSTIVPAAAEAADQGEESVEHEAGIEEIGEDSHDEAEYLLAAVATKPKAAGREEPTTPKRPRGRPRKDVSATDVPSLAFSNSTQTKKQNVLSMMRAMTHPSQAEVTVESEARPSADADGDIAMAGEESRPSALPEQHEDRDLQEEGDEVDILISKSHKGKEKKAATAPSEKPVGKSPPKVKGARAAVSLEVGPDQEDEVLDTVNEGPESSQQTGTTSSSRASSVASDSPRKKRGPSSAKKRKDEELKKQNQSLMDMWGPGRSKK